MKAVREAKRSPAASESRTSRRVATAAPAAGEASAGGSVTSASFSAASPSGVRQSEGAPARAALRSPSKIVPSATAWA